MIWAARDDFRKLEDDFPSAFRGLRVHACFKRARRVIHLWRESQKKREEAEQYDVMTASQIEVEPIEVDQPPAVKTDGL